MVRLYFQSSQDDIRLRVPVLLPHNHCLLSQTVLHFPIQVRVFIQVHQKRFAEVHLAMEYQLLFKLVLESHLILS